ncbi:hypothetical protein pb186bvf_011627 [Paramecium bursaria]
MIVQNSNKQVKLKSNPWNQKQINNQGFGLCQTYYKQKYKLGSNKENLDELADYELIIKQANRISELKQQLANQVVDQQFGQIVDPEKFQNRISQLQQVQDIIEKVDESLDQCHQCYEQTQNNQWIKTDSSVYITVPTSNKSQFIQLLKNFKSKPQIEYPDNQINLQIATLKDINKMGQNIQDFWQKFDDLNKQL